MLKVGQVRQFQSRQRKIFKHGKKFIIKHIWEAKIWGKWMADIIYMDGYTASFDTQAILEYSEAI